MTKIEKLLMSPQKVFTVSDLAVLWQISERKKLWEVIKYYLRTNRLQRMKRGVYTLDVNQMVSPLEVAVNIFPPAYISYVTALGIHGINVQYYESIHAMANSSKVVTLPTGKKIVFHQLKETILFNQAGLVQEENYLIASAERAICDTLYLEPHFVFDNLHNVSRAKLIEICQLYGNANLEKRIHKIILPLIDQQE